MSFEHELSEGHVGLQPRHEHAPCQARGTDAILIYAEDPNALANWYSGDHGLSGISQSEDHQRHPLFDRRAVHLGIRGRECLDAVGRSLMVIYRVDDLDAFLVAMERGGVHVDKVLDEGHGRFACFSDANGHPIEVWSPSRPRSAASGGC